MTRLKQGILNKVLGSFDTDQLARSIIYLDSKLIHAGKMIRVGDVIINLPWDAHIVFIDFEPRANWGHTCCYLAICKDSDEIIQVPAQMPPFLKTQASTFNLLWRGAFAPEWTVMTNKTS